MEQSQSAMDDIDSLMLLRSDIYTSADADRRSVFCPKKLEAFASNMVVRLTPFSEEHTWLYHNTLSCLLEPLPREYLLIRFAQATLPNWNRSS